MSITDTTLAETEILLAQPRGFCAGVDRAIEIVERAIAAVRRADLRAPRDRPQHLRGRTTCARRARSSSRTWPKCRRAPRSFSARTACQSSAVGGRGARSSGVRRHLSARDQGAHRSRQAAPARATRFIMIGHKGHPEVEGTMGQRARASIWSKTWKTCRHCSWPIRRGSRSSRRPRCRSTTRPKSSAR